MCVFGDRFLPQRERQFKNLLLRRLIRALFFCDRGYPCGIYITVICQLNSKGRKFEIKAQRSWEITQLSWIASHSKSVLSVYSLKASTVPVRGCLILPFSFPLFHFDRTHKRYYYTNRVTGDSQWEYPSDETESDVKEDTSAVETSSQSSTAAVSSSQTSVPMWNYSGKM